MNKLGALVVLCAASTSCGTTRKTEAAREASFSGRATTAGPSSTCRAEVDGQSVPDGKGWTRKLTFVEKK